MENCELDKYAKEVARTLLEKHSEYIQKGMSFENALEDYMSAEDRSFMEDVAEYPNRMGNQYTFQILKRKIVEDLEFASCVACMYDSEKYQEHQEELKTKKIRALEPVFFVIKRNYAFEKIEEVIIQHNTKWYMVALVNSF